MGFFFHNIFFSKILSLLFFYSISPGYWTVLAWCEYRTGLAEFTQQTIEHKILPSYKQTEQEQRT
jgi:hypothetical protein